MNERTGQNPSRIIFNSIGQLSLEKIREMLPYTQHNMRFWGSEIDRLGLEIGKARHELHQVTYALQQAQASVASTNIVASMVQSNIYMLYNQPIAVHAAQVAARTAFDLHTNTISLTNHIAGLEQQLRYAKTQHESYRQNIKYLYQKEADIKREVITKQLEDARARTKAAREQDEATAAAEAEAQARKAAAEAKATEEARVAAEEAQKVDTEARKAAKKAREAEAKKAAAEAKATEEARVAAEEAEAKKAAAQAKATEKARVAEAKKAAAEAKATEEARVAAEEAEAKKATSEVKASSDTVAKAKAEVRNTKPATKKPNKKMTKKEQDAENTKFLDEAFKQAQQERADKAIADARAQAAKEVAAAQAKASADIAVAQDHAAKRIEEAQKGVQSVKQTQIDALINMKVDVYLNQCSVIGTIYKSRPSMVLKEDPNINNPQGIDGNTYLHHAAVRGDETIVRTLIAMGANAHQKNKKGKCPSDLTHNENIIKILKEDINPQLPETNSESDTELFTKLFLLHYAVEPIVKAVEL